jgi:CRP/FNR family transcriptional regulator, cyclic AMP receptor protein
VRVQSRSMAARKPRSARRRSVGQFDPERFLASTRLPKRITDYKRGTVIYAQGEAATSVLYVQHGRVNLSVVSQGGKEAVVAVLGARDFFGEGCLAGQTVRMSTATAMIDTRVLTIRRGRMQRLLQREPPFSERFIAHILARNIRVEEDLVDRLFNSVEKRFARALILMARYGRAEGDAWILPKVSQETLAEMVGTTRPRINFFMNKFRALGFIDYNGELVVRTSLLGVVLHD